MYHLRQKVWHWTELLANKEKQSKDIQVVFHLLSTSHHFRVEEIHPNMQLQWVTKDCLQASHPRGCRPHCHLWIETRRQFKDGHGWFVVLKRTPRFSLHCLENPLELSRWKDVVGYPVSLAFLDRIISISPVASRWCEQGLQTCSPSPPPYAEPKAERSSQMTSALLNPLPNSS